MTIKSDEFGAYSDWTSESFENDVSGALISLYETKIAGQKNNHPSQRITEQTLAAARRVGVYLPSESRIIMPDRVDTYYALPAFAALSLDVSRAEREAHHIKGYRQNNYVERIPRLPNHYTRKGGGELYRVVLMLMQENGQVQGRANYLSVDKEGNVYPCDLACNGSTQLRHEPHILEQSKQHLIFTMNYWTDKAHVWTIEAKEAEARCVVGVDREQVKSLLYARSLPTTATGRKRPILHLVAAHRRRIKEGIDIQIDDFLRGVSTVEMNGTVFKVRAPDALKLGN